jgi:hypothetical protein
MRRDPTIPLFLWVATALVVHAIGGGGATEVSRVLEEKAGIRDFAQAVGRSARRAHEPTEVALLDPTAEPDVAEEAQPDAPVADEEHRTDDPTPEPEAPEPKPEEKKTPEPEPKAVPEEKKPPEKQDEPKPVEAVKVPPALPLDNRRVAVQQHVKEDQEDNPDAKFAAEHANHVDEETQARITASDQNDPNPTPGGHFAGSHTEPGNSDEAKVAQSEEVRGDDRLAPGSEAGDDPKDQTSQAAKVMQLESVARVAPRAPAPQPRAPQEAARPPAPATADSPDVIASDSGTGAVPKAQAAQAAQPAYKPKPSNKPTDLLGFGATGVTKNGVNLNLTHSAAMAMMGRDELAQMRRRAGEKRLSQHRGSWTTLGIERWRASLENYVATVKPGNQTALNAARVPFAAYLNQVHNRIHLTFADDFLASLNGLPPNHPLSQRGMSTHLEIALSKEDGRIVRIGITKSSGVTMFDVGALEAVSKSAPYGVPPGSIVSSDGNVYLHWEFHRNPEWACSTYFARPFILNLGQTPAPPRVEPPPPPDYDAKPADERSGRIERDRPERGGATPG